MTTRFSAIPAAGAAPAQASESTAAAAGSTATRTALASQAVLIGLDWGTSSLRAYLFHASGEVLATQASTAGIMNLPRPAKDGGFDAAFEETCGAWLVAAPQLPVVAAGMVGSAQGWIEAPYVGTPADADALVAGIVRAQAACGANVHVVPGVLQPGELPNVMRGEETQVFGALEAADGGESGTGTGTGTGTCTDSDTASGAGSGSASGTGGPAALIGLPGTHNKWVSVQNGRIEQFHTFMTGEIFAALSEHTILGRTMTTPGRPDTGAFVRGVDVAREKGEAGLLATVFSTRTLGLTGQLPSEQQPDYLSGLLIGHELVGLEAVLARRQASLAGCELSLIGNEALCERYRLALARFGCDRARLVKSATERGLWRIACAAGLVVRRDGGESAGLVR